MKLANGRTWRFIADHDSEWLCDDLALIAGLNTASPDTCETIALVSGDRGPMLADVMEKARKLPGAMTLPEGGWVKINHKILEFWGQPGVPFAVGATFGHRNRLMDILQVQHMLYPVVAGEIAAGSLPVHAALVERAGMGVIIAAKGGTGKSTCYQRIPAPWRGLCDDEALIVKTGDDGYRVHPFPTWSEHLWTPSERTWRVERHVCLAAICFLEQADTDVAVPYPRGKAAASLYLSSVEAFGKYELNMDAARMAEFRARMLENACQIALSTPAYILKATLDGRFWDAIDGVLSSGESTLPGPGLKEQSSIT